MAQITKGMTIGELVNKYHNKCPKVIEVLMESGMHCIGCFHSQMESLEMGALEHGIDPNTLVERLNLTLESATE